MAALAGDSLFVPGAVRTEDNGIVCPLLPGGILPLLP